MDAPDRQPGTKAEQTTLLTGPSLDGEGVTLQCITTGRGRVPRSAAVVRLDKESSAVTRGIPAVLEVAPV